MPLDFVRPHLLRPEAEIARQAMQNNIDWFKSTCPGCIANQRTGCSAHVEIIKKLKDLRRRFDFREVT